MSYHFTLPGTVYVFVRFATSMPQIQKPSFTQLVSVQRYLLYVLYFIQYLSVSLHCSASFWTD